MNNAHRETLIELQKINKKKIISLNYSKYISTLISLLIYRFI